MKLLILEIALHYRKLLQQLQQQRQLLNKLPYSQQSRKFKTLKTSVLKKLFRRIVRPMMPYIENNRKTWTVATLSPTQPPTRRIQATTPAEELYNYCEVLNCDFNSKLQIALIFKAPN